MDKIDLDFIEKISSIFGSFSLFIALISFLYSKKKDKKHRVFEQITFFRENIIPKTNEIIEDSRKIYEKDFILPRVKLDEPNSKSIIKNFKKEAEKQLELLKKDSQIIKKQIFLFNLLEEFSLKIFSWKIQEEKEFDSIKYSFLETIETNAVTLIFFKEFQNNMYGTVLRLYQCWKDEADREPLEEKIEKLMLKYKRK